MPPALKAYFYPGDLTGHEFVYDDEEARRISDETKTAVLSHDIESGKLEGWESATIRLWDQGKSTPYTEPRAKAGEPLSSHVVGIRQPIGRSSSVALSGRWMIDLTSSSLSVASVIDRASRRAFSAHR